MMKPPGKKISLPAVHKWRRNSYPHSVEQKAGYRNAVTRGCSSGYTFEKNVRERKGVSSRIRSPATCVNG